jgi:hypothetical protein
LGGGHFKSPKADDNAAKALRIWYLLLLYRQLSQRLEMAGTKMTRKGSEVASILQ